jgi:arsenate reductase-like glutaredoxin family protein
MTCKKARGFLERHAVEVEDMTDAGKQKKGRAEALKLARDADEVIVAKGKNVVRFDMAKDTPDDATLLTHILGPTGNLRAPTARIGRTLLIGFNEEAYRDFVT